MRLTKDDIKKLPSRMRLQIEGAQRQHVKQQKKPNSRSPTSGKKVPFCQYPDTSPAVVLFNAINKHFGSALYANGDAAHEVLVDGCPKRWRYDHLIVSKRVFIEFNGYQHHSSLKAFKRDHNKRAYAQTLGFAIFDTTNQMVREDVDSVIITLEQILSHRRTYRDVIKPYGKCYTKVFLEAP